MRKMTREEAKAWKSAWGEARALQIEELRKESPRTRFGQLCALMSSDFLARGMAGPPHDDSECVLDRWMRLRGACGRR